VWQACELLYTSYLLTYLAHGLCSFNVELIIIIIIIIIIYHGTQFPGNEKNAMQYKQVQKSSIINISIIIILLYFKGFTQSKCRSYRKLLATTYGMLKSINVACAFVLLKCLCVKNVQDFDST